MAVTEAFASTSSEDECSVESPTPSEYDPSDSMFHRVALNSRGVSFSQSSTFRRPYFVTLYLLLLCSPASASLTPPQWLVFYNPHSGQGMPFEKMVGTLYIGNREWCSNLFLLKVIDPATNRIYVGGVNHLYDLESEASTFRQRVHTQTGPKLDCELGGKTGGKFLNILLHVFYNSFLLLLVLFF